MKPEGRDGRVANNWFWHGIYWRSIFVSALLLAALLLVDAGASGLGMLAAMALDPLRLSLAVALRILFVCTAAALSIDANLRAGVLSQAVARTALFEGAINTVMAGPLVYMAVQSVRASLGLAPSGLGPHMAASALLGLVFGSVGGAVSWSKHRPDGA